MSDQVIDTSVNTNKVLTHELQLGEQLNKCVHANRRSDFSLMLAMLADDVRLQSQFILPQHETDTHEVNNDVLRREFQLPKEAPLALNSMHDIKDFSQASLVANKCLSQLHLLEALKPKAIAFRDDASHIDSQILSNTSIHCQNRYKADKTTLDDGEESAPQRLPFNAKEWLSSIQTNMVKAPLASAYSELA